MTLNIGKGHELPDEAVTETFAMLAKRGMGKSNAAVVMAEEMWDARHQWVAIDPKGDWWGIRSSADGKGDGLPVAVFGGRHGDLPLDATDGTLMARLVVERSITAVLDVSLFSKADQIRFVTDFAETLFRAMGDDPRPLHLFLEEAEEFLPQQVRPASARMVGAYSKIAKQGRTLGLGVTLITQRSASLNKDALSQTDTLILFRTVSPHDRKAVVAWAEHHDEAKDVASTLAQLQPGESWILSPGFLGKIERVVWRRRRTFDSGATPLTGAGKRRDPVSLADIDLAEIKELMADTVERAKADDPKLLRAEIASLRRDLAEQQPAPADPVEVEVRVEVPVVPAEVIEAMTATLDVMTAAVDTTATLADTIRAALDQAPVEVRQAPAPRPAPTPAPVRHTTPMPAAPSPKIEGLGKGEWKVLHVLAEYPEGRTVSQVAFLAGYSARASTIGNIIAALRREGLVERDQPIRLTAAGRDLAPVVEQPTGAELLAKWYAHPRMGEGERKVLEALIEAWPHALGLDELCDRTGYSPTASTIGNIVARLRKLGIVAKGARALHPDFASAIGA